MLEINVVGAAILEGVKVLAAQRSEKMSPPFKWEFAGGKVESGETHEQALSREIHEELGILIRVGGFLAKGSFDDGDKRIILYVYEASIVEGSPVSREHSDVRWIEIDAIGSLDWAEPDIPACRELMRRYGSICCGGL
jgi:8-oxo-dGTP diphosphatase